MRDCDFVGAACEVGRRSRRSERRLFGRCMSARTQCPYYVQM
jgi:hypothetical protein